MISIMFLAVLLDRPALALRNVVLAATLILVAVARKPVRRRLPDVVRRRGGAGLRLRGAAQRASGARADASTRASRLVAVLRRHRAVDADRERRGGAVRRLPLPQEPAVRGDRQPHRHPGLQHARHAGGAGGAGRHAVRARGAAAVGDGAGASRRWCGCAQRVAELPGAVLRVPAMPTRGVRADGRRRAVADAVADALAARWASR